jgi:thiamine pyrophosphokinase
MRYSGKFGAGVRGVLFIGGYGPGADFIHRIIRPGDLLCAADSGLDSALDAGVRPDLVVGDMDSLSDRLLLDGYPPDCVVIHSTDKDQTDTELGIRYLRERGCSDFVLIGGGEGRLDHTLALWSLFDSDLPPDLWYTSREEILSVDGLHRISGAAGMGLSFFPSGPGPWDVSSSGLKWELDVVNWAGGGFSLSNRMSGSLAEIHVRSGGLIQIRPIGDVFPNQH